MQTNSISKNIFLTITIFSSLGLSIALVSQHVFGMQPCAWCVLQRLILIGTILFSLLGYTFDKHLRINKLFSIAGLIVASTGIIAAWYQYSVAANMFSCAQTFADRFISSSGLDSIIPWLFGIYATCMDAKVSLLGIEYALWGLILFVLILVLNLINLLIKPR